MDNLTKEQRRKNMQNIKSTKTLPELKVMRELKRKKIYFASHPKKIFGKPDIVFRRKKIAVFIDSDFWHCHPDHFVMPKTNVDYWSNKIKLNKKRDTKVNQELGNKGWKILRFWEHEINKEFDRCIDTILEVIGHENKTNLE